MTRQEASIIIGNIPINGDGCYTIPEYQQAKAMAIKALEHPELNVVAIVPCGDAISRQAVLDLMQIKMGGKELYKAVYELPPVTPQPKTGYWISWYEIIEEEWGTEHNPHCKCSECSTEVDPHTSKFIKCCPVCGTKMVGYKKREET